MFSLIPSIVIQLFWWRPSVVLVFWWILIHLCYFPLSQFPLGRMPWAVLDIRNRGLWLSPLELVFCKQSWRHPGSNGGRSCLSVLSVVLRGLQLSAFQSVSAPASSHSSLPLEDGRCILADPDLDLALLVHVFTEDLNPSLSSALLGRLTVTHSTTHAMGQTFSWVPLRVVSCVCMLLLS